MSSHTYAHKITSLKDCLCQRCYNPATWQATYSYRNNDGSEGTHLENVCDNHAEEFANKHVLQFPATCKAVRTRTSCEVSISRG
jgi:hypothetical protein